MWRISPDFWDTWEALREQLDLLRDWLPWKKPGAYPDGDIIPVSCISNFGPWEAPRYSNFSFAEKRTVLSVWAIMNSPIILGGDLTAIDMPTLKLLQNPYISMLDAFAEEAKITEEPGGVRRFRCGIKGRRELYALAIVNASEDVICADEPSEAVVNVWGNCSQFLAPHDCALYLCRSSDT